MLHWASPLPRKSGGVFLGENLSTQVMIGGTIVIAGVALILTDKG